jgi:hypothetical protein
MATAFIFSFRTKNLLFIHYNLEREIGSWNIGDKPLEQLVYL